MDISETIVVYDIKVGRWSLLNEYIKLYEYERSRSFIDIGPSNSDSIFSNFFSSITSRPIEAKFHVVLQWDGGMHVRSIQVTRPRWPPYPYMVKTFKNLLLRNERADDLEEIWFAAFGTQVLSTLSKWWSWVDLDHFYDRVRFVS